MIGEKRGKMTLVGLPTKNGLTGPFHDKTLLVSYEGPEIPVWPKQLRGGLTEFIDTDGKFIGYDTEAGLNDRNRTLDWGLVRGDPMTRLKSEGYFGRLLKLRMPHGPIAEVDVGYDLEATISDKTIEKFFKRFNVGTVGHHDPSPSVLAVAINKAVGGKPLVNQI